MTKNKPIALLSVTDKSGIVEFARELHQLGFKLLSTGGTAKLLQNEKLDVTEVSNYTDSPEIMDGRVKTLHPRVHGGILYDRSNAKHIAEAHDMGIQSIDLVVVNLYQFEKEAKNKNLSLEEAIEFIDIGGPTMLRAAAKNWQYCSPVIDPQDYSEIISQLKKGALSKELRQQLAAKTFATISAYDSMITQYFMQALQSDTQQLPKTTTIGLQEIQGLRYGENPHQKASIYRLTGSTQDGFGNLKILQGKEVSYNNLLDLDAACNLVHDFYGTTAVAIIKHTNPCGVAIGDKNDLEKIYRQALTGDPKSAFGGIVAVNAEIDKKTALAMNELFLECIAAPSFSQEALEIFASKKNLRLLLAPWLLTKKTTPQINYRSIRGAILAQTEDLPQSDKKEWKVATVKSPTAEQWNDLAFAMVVATHVKSNTIVYAKDGKTITVGAGQMSRIDAAEFAAQKAKEEGKSLVGAVLASDAFFPFRDCVDLAAKYKIAAIVQPGGSMRDQESIDAANEAGMAMVFTGERHFKH